MATKGYILLDGNKIIEAGNTTKPDPWTDNHVLIPSMGVDPTTLVGQYYDPINKAIFASYDGRTGKFYDSVPLTDEEAQAIAIETAENVQKITAANWMVRFIEDAFNAGVPVTPERVPSYVTNVLDKVLGEGEYSFAITEPEQP